MQVTTCHRLARWAVVFSVAVVAVGCARATDGAANDANKGPEVNDGGAPTAPGTFGVAITPSAPHTLDDLTAVVTDNNSPVAYALQWSKNGAVQTMITGATVSNALTTKHDVWAADLVDAHGTSLSHAEVTIANTPPTAPTAGLPASVAAASPIQCALVSDATDADGDAISYSGTWTRNGGAFATAGQTVFAQDTVPAGTSAVGDAWTCVIAASDGEASTPSAPVSTTSMGCAGTTQAVTTFSYTGAPQTFVVAACTTTLTIEVWGAQGGDGGGGNGGYAKGTLAVTAGQTFYVEVGGAGIGTGYNGGGAGVTMAGSATPAPPPANGGGASDVRINDDQLTSRIIVGGGGGGGPKSDLAKYYVGGTGGGGSCGANYCGGGAAGGEGSNGDSTTSVSDPGGVTGGAGFTGEFGGGGGGGGLTSGGGGSCETYAAPTTCGKAGGLGVGGAGVGPVVPNAVYCFEGTSDGDGTAGGGGGYYGGGGTAMEFCGGGGGGGGASWTGTLTSPVFEPGVQGGNGKVVITPS